MNDQFQRKREKDSVQKKKNRTNSDNYFHPDLFSDKFFISDKIVKVYNDKCNFYYL